MIWNQMKFLHSFQLYWLSIWFLYRWVVWFDSKNIIFPLNRLFDGGLFHKFIDKIRMVLTVIFDLTPFHPIIFGIQNITRSFFVHENIKSGSKMLLVALKYLVLFSTPFWLIWLSYFSFCFSIGRGRWFQWIQNISNKRT